MQHLRRALVRVSGESRTPFLNRMLTQTLHPDAAGQYGLLLEANGQLIAGAYWLHRDEAWWAITHASQATALVQGLQKYVFFRDAVTLTELEVHCVSVKASPSGSFVDTGECATVEDWQAASDDISDDPEPVTRRRAGVPVLGLEVLPGDHPLEWDLGYSLAQKGCYVGQEVIERMWSRARRARGRVLVTSDQEIAHGASWDDPLCGTLEIRSPVYDPAAQQWIALGLCKILPGTHEPWHLSPGLTVHNLAQGGPLPPSLSQSYSVWAGVNPNEN